MARDNPLYGKLAEMRTREDVVAQHLEVGGILTARATSYFRPAQLDETGSQDDTRERVRDIVAVTRELGNTKIGVAKATERDLSGGLPVLLESLRNPPHSADEPPRNEEVRQYAHEEGREVGRVQVWQRRHCSRESDEPEKNAEEPC
jgi:hypothetical protein